ncbi:MAG: WD40 repeat domain-containing protein [Phototrophicaceae bacterium]
MRSTFLAALLLTLGLLPVTAQETTPAPSDDDAALITTENAADLTLVNRLTGHSMAVTAVDFHPGGALLASAGDDLSLRLWDLATSEQLTEVYPHNSAIKDVAFHPEGTLLVSASWDRSVQLYDVDLDAEDPDALLMNRPSLTGFQHIVEGVTFNDEGLWFAFAVGDGTVHVINTADFSLRFIYPVASLKVEALSFAPGALPDGRRLLAASTGFPSDTVALLSTRGDEPATLDHGHDGAVTALAFSPLVAGEAVAPGATVEGPRLLATLGDDGTLRLWSITVPDVTETAPFAPQVERLALLTPDTDTPAWYTAAAFNPAGDLLAAATLDGTVHLFDMRDPAAPRFIGELAPALETRLNTLAFSPAGDLLAVGGDPTISLWALHNHTDGG